MSSEVDKPEEKIVSTPEIMVGMSPWPWRFDGVISGLDYHYISLPASNLKIQITTRMLQKYINEQKGVNPMTGPEYYSALIKIVLAAPYN